MATRLQKIIEETTVGLPPAPGKLRYKLFSSSHSIKKNNENVFIKANL
jgi:hypothetical protein